MPTVAPPRPESVPAHARHESAARQRLAISRHEAAAHVAAFAHPRSKKPIVLAVAGGALLLLAGIWGLDRAGRQAAIRTALDSPAVRTLGTNFGQRAVVTLLDESTVALGADSRVYVPPAFGERFRVLRLEGTARFTARPDPDKPFELRVPGAVFRALGTTFSVSAFPDEPVTVRVDQGEVEAVIGDDVRRLKRGATLAIDQGLVRQPGDTELLETFGWIDEQMVISDRPLGEALRQLRRWYGSDVIVSDSALLDRRVSAYASLNSLRDVILAFEKTGGLKLGWTNGNRTMVLEDARERPGPALK